jgi:Nucleotidyl transferase of unknown function (DUF2204)
LSQLARLGGHPRLVANEQQKPLPVSSSQQPPFPEEQQQLFREVLELFNRQGISYAVSGAFALQKHTGIWRDTKDLDLFLPMDNVSAALGALHAKGFQTEICDPVWLAKAHRDEYFVDLITGMSNAVITVDASWISHAQSSEVFGVPTCVLAPEELIASKLFVTRRERFDGADVVHVIHGTCGRLDWSRVLALVGEHWGVVFWAMVLFQYVYPAQAGYIPRAVWDDLLARFRSQIEHPDPKAQFRGSLIDEKMFAIDAAEWGFENLVEQFRSMRKKEFSLSCEDGAA